MPSKIFGLFYLHENSVLKFVTQDWCTRFAKRGYDTEIINLAERSDVEKLKAALQKGEVAFCFGIQGVGSRLTWGAHENLWSHYKVPFLCLHHDSPSCNIYNHFCDSRYVANIYFFDCFYDLQKRYIKSGQISEKLPFEIDWQIPGRYYTLDGKPLPPEHYAPVVFRRSGTAPQDRPIRMTFLKSGQSPLYFADQINQIARPLRDVVWGAIEQAWKNANFSIGDLLTDAFTASGFDTKEHWDEFWGFANLVENYIRSKRAADLVEWLKTQPGALIVGNGWDFIDQTHARATFRPAITAEHTLQLFFQSQFIFNTSPYGKDIIHERVFQGLGCYCAVVSDTNQYWETHFAGVPSLYRFDWGSDPVAAWNEAVNDPLAMEKARQLTAGDRIIDKLIGNSNITKLLDIAEKVREFAA